MLLGGGGLDPAQEPMARPNGVLRNGPGGAGQGAGAGVQLLNANCYYLVIMEALMAMDAEARRENLARWRAINPIAPHYAG